MHRSRKKYTGMMPALLCLTLTLLLAGCSLPGSASPPVKVGKAPINQQTYISPIVLLNGNADLTTLDPALAYDQNSLNVISMISTGLVELDDHMQVQPQLASSWDRSSDGLTWTFHLRKNLKFSDGTLINANDVAYSINRALDPTTKSTVSPIYLDLILNSDKLLGGRISTLINNGGLQVVDASTLKITTKVSAPYFLSMLAHTCAYVVEQKMLTKYGDKFTDHLNEGGSSGPFMVQQYIHGQKIQLVPNPYYYGSKPQLRSVIFPLYTQEEAAYNDYAAGRVDTAGVPLAALPAIAKRPDYHQVPQLWINYYTMNYKVPPFDNISIRQAFALSIDKEAIAKNVWKNTVTPTNHIIPLGMPDYNAKLTGPDGTQSLTGNAKEAQTLLQQGLEQEKWSSVSQMPAIKLTYASGSQFDQEVSSMIAMWQKVLGVTVTADPVDSNTLLDQVSGATGNSQGLQMWGLSWVAEYPDSQDWLTRQFDNGSVFNNMNYGQNDSQHAALQQNIQKQLEKADSNFQDAPRQQAYQQAEQQLVNDVAWLPIDQVDSVFLRKPFVSGFIDNGIDILPPDDWSKIFILQH